MVVLIVGATGAVGRPLVQQLVSAGHEVIGTTLSAQQLGQLSSASAAGIVVDAFDPGALRLSQPLRPGGFDDWLQTTNALRRDVTPV